jgi:hypothetical protein
MNLNVVYCVRLGKMCTCGPYSMCLRIGLLFYSLF